MIEPILVEDDLAFASEETMPASDRANDAAHGDAHDGIPGSRSLSSLVMRIAGDAVSRGLLDVDPEISIDYRRVLCLRDGSRVDIQLTRILPCLKCGTIHGRDGGATCRSRTTTRQGP